MKKDTERQVGLRVGLPAFFALEVEGYYRHTSGAHRALAFPDFLGFLCGLGLEEYKRLSGAPDHAPEARADMTPEEPEADGWDWPSAGEGLAIGGEAAALMDRINRRAVRVV